MSLARYLSKLGALLNSSGKITPAAMANGGAEFGNRNRIINGEFDVWQLGTSQSVTSTGYFGPDQWMWIFDGSPASTGTVSRGEFTLGQTDVPGNPKYYMQYSYTAVNTPNHYIRQMIEGVHTFAGETVTYSFWMRCTSGTIACQFQNQQEFGIGGSPSAGVYGIGTQNFTLTTTWQKFTFTHTMPSIAGKTLGTAGDSVNPSVYFPTNGSGTIQWTRVQFEKGSNATDFDRRMVGEEFRLCQRYLQRLNQTDGGYSFNYAALRDGTYWMVPIRMSVPMRVAPSLFDPTYSMTGRSAGISTGQINVYNLTLAGTTTCNAGTASWDIAQATTEKALLRFTGTSMTGSTGHVGGVDSFIVGSRFFLSARM